VQALTNARIAIQSGRHVLLGQDERACTDACRVAASATRLFSTACDSLFVCVCVPPQCDLRYQSRPYFMSSTVKPWTPTFAQGGIFATDGSSEWGTANRVYLKYCRYLARGVGICCVTHLLCWLWLCAAH
jgi:hypothetical protein